MKDVSSIGLQTHPSKCLPRCTASTAPANAGAAEPASPGAALKRRLRWATLVVTALALLLPSCDRFVGEAKITSLFRAPVAVKDPDYVVLRPVFENPSAGLVAATADGGTVYYKPSERILDLRQLDLSTVRIEERRGQIPEYVIVIQTTQAGAEPLREWTRAHIDQRLGVWVGGQLISAPVIKSEISDMIVLAGGFSKSQAERVVERLRRGGAA